MDQKVDQIYIVFVKKKRKKKFLFDPILALKMMHHHISGSTLKMFFKVFAQWTGQEILENYFDDFSEKNSSLGQIGHFWAWKWCVLIYTFERCRNVHEHYIYDFSCKIAFLSRAVMLLNATHYIKCFSNKGKDREDTQAPLQNEKSLRNCSTIRVICTVVTP